MEALVNNSDNTDNKEQNNADLGVKSELQLDRNRACHLRDRDINFRAALNIFRRLTRNINKRVRTLRGKGKLLTLVDELLKMIETALYHANMAGIRNRLQMDNKSFVSLEERVVVDFLLSFKASCENIKHIISHILLLQKSKEGDEPQSSLMKTYIRRMLTFDEDSLIDFTLHLKKRVLLFNKTIEIQKKLR